MLSALHEGSPLSGGELARRAAVAPSTASEHLTRLLDAGLVAGERRGRCRLYRLADDDVARAWETLSVIAPRRHVDSLRTASAGAALVEARTCYDHLAGRLGVAVTEALLSSRALTEQDGVFVLGSNARVFARLGIDVAAIRGRRPLVLRCLDWSERRRISPALSERPSPPARSRRDGSSVCRPGEPCGSRGRGAGALPRRSASTSPAARVGFVSRPAQLLNLGTVPYVEAWELQRAVAADVFDGERPDTVLLLEHPPVVTIGRRTGGEELHLPAGVDVDVVETNRGGKSTYHGPGQLVCYPILDLNRHGRDVKRYCRDLEEAVVQTLAAFALNGRTIEGLTGVWMTPPPRKVASIGVHISRWVTTHGYALNVDLDPAPFTSWITACGLADAAFTTMARELDRPVSVEEVRPAAAEAFSNIFALVFEEIHEQLATSR
jgi:lipoyl(octanoyl) transferase